MNLAELDNFQLAKAIDFNTDLNPQVFMGNKMRPMVRNKLMEIADHFREFLGVQDIALVDIEVSGSNAAYSYTPHSDIDLHLIVDFTQLPDSDIYRELFDSKKYQYNDMHDIKIKGYDVELYVQDAVQAHHSLGSYSVMKDDWNRIPTKQRANLNDTATLLKYENLKNLAIRALASDNRKYLNDVLDLVKKYRQAGLDKHGEFGPENLAFKMLRTDGYFAKLWAKKRAHDDRDLSLEHTKEKPEALAQELKAEFETGKSTHATEGMIKRLFAARSSLFDDFDYDYIHEAAGNLSVFEASYNGNIGVMEVMKFYEIAPKKQVDLLTRLIAANKNKEAWQLIQKVTNTRLKGKQFASEGVGLIRKGSNVTPDVGEAQTRIEAEKLGFKTTDDGIPPMLQTNGVPKGLNESIDAFHADTTDMPYYDNMMQNPEYFERAKGIATELIKMSPQEYIKRAAKGFGKTPDEIVSQRDPELAASYAEKMQSGEKFPILTLDYSKGPRISQEGLHRSMAAIQAGVSEVPVLIVKATD